MPTHRVEKIEEELERVKTLISLGVELGERCSPDSAAPVIVFAAFSQGCGIA